MSWSASLSDPSLAVALPDSPACGARLVGPGAIDRLSVGGALVMRQLLVAMPADYFVRPGPLPWQLRIR